MNSKRTADDGTTAEMHCGSAGAIIALVLGAILVVIGVGGADQSNHSV